MPNFSQRSKDNLATCHLDLQRVMLEAIKVADFAVLCGHRGQAAQDEAYATGRSKLLWPNSSHNELPSLAVDLAPWPIDWNDSGRFHYLAGVVMTVARQLGVVLEWGGDWQILVDLPHYQIAEVPGDPPA